MCTQVTSSRQHECTHSYDTEREGCWKDAAHGTVRSWTSRQFSWLSFSASRRFHHVSTLAAFATRELGGSFHESGARTLVSSNDLLGRSSERSVPARRLHSAFFMWYVRVVAGDLPARRRPRTHGVHKKGRAWNSQVSSRTATQPASRREPVIRSTGAPGLIGDGRCQRATLPAPRQGHHSPAGRVTMSQSILPGARQVPTSSSRRAGYPCLSEASPETPAPANTRGAGAPQNAAFRNLLRVTVTRRKRTAIPARTSWCQRPISPIQLHRGAGRNRTDE